MSFKWDDPFYLDDQLSEDERLIPIRPVTCAGQTSATSSQAWQENFDREIMNEMGSRSTRFDFARKVRLLRCELCRYSWLLAKLSEWIRLSLGDECGLVMHRLYLLVNPT